MEEIISFEEQCLVNHSAVADPETLPPPDLLLFSFQGRIQDFHKAQWGQPIIWPNFPENCMKMKKIGMEARQKVNMYIRHWF